MKENMKTNWKLQHVDITDIHNKVNDLRKEERKTGAASATEDTDERSRLLWESSFIT